MISAATLSSHNSSNLARAMPLISANQLREFGFPFCGTVAQERRRAFGREQRLPNRRRADRVAAHGPHAAAILRGANRCLIECPTEDGRGSEQQNAAAVFCRPFTRINRPSVLSEILLKAESPLKGIPRSS